ncbi:unnamed protein product [Parascedosporium putredinis]|uniref:Protein transport protein SEC22 n=1 Tax=Parascedosporium putredinis TaxID=1442378 RepID=A0A9P1GUC0_9PEZI|nr:unnamed protein product [Parascedosporium putredinis]CAI7987542.1 unnamed protein product [Parascedosporium putredinis]
MIRSTQIARLDGLMLCASVDDEQSETSVGEVKSQIRQILRKLTRNSEAQASIESGSYILHYLIDSDIVHAPALRPYAFMDFDTFISRTKATYSDARATQNLDRLNDELRDVTKVMTKNIEDLFKKYRKAAVRINWDLLVKQYGPFAALGFIILVFFWWRFF